MCMSTLVAVVNGESELEYDRSKSLPEKQLSYLDKMDVQMDTGIPSGQGSILAPDIEQKAQFVASQLMTAIEKGDEQLMSASMAYLAVRMPNLKQVSVEEKEGDKHISLIYDREYAPAQMVNFVKPEHLDS